MTDTQTPELTESNVPKQPPGEYQDHKAKSLRLYVSDKGARTYGFYKWSPFKRAPVRQKIGRHPEMRLDEARKAANALAVRVANGEDISPKPIVRQATLKALVDDYSKKLKQECRSNWGWVEDTITFHGSDWLKKELPTISQAMIAERQRRIAYGDDDHEARGPAAGSTFVKALRALFNFAEKEQGYLGKNVAAHVDRIPGKARQRVLSEAERDAILTALDSPRFLPHVRPLFRLLMLTGVRRSNMTSARKDQINLDAAVWTIPAPDAKGRQELRIQLLPEAVELFRAQFAKHPESPWVFPTVSGSYSGHLEEVWPVWKAVLAEAGVDHGITVHDLRRTFGSRLLNQDVPMAVVSKLLGHQDVSTTAKHYAFVSDEAAAKHLNRAKL